MNSSNFNQTEIREVFNKESYISIVESLLFVSGEPMKLKDIASIIECSIPYTNEILKQMAHNYEEESRGIKLISINEEYQLVTKPQNSEFIQRILRTNIRQSLSQASLETLAIIVYKQPITRVDIDEIRGVKSDSAVAKLVERGLIKENGRLDVPGRPILYVTTDEFLKQFNLQNLGELPSIEQFMLENMDKEIEGMDIQELETQEVE
jgi:segregation and condensation protein B